MKVVCISDTHEQHDSIEVPNGDLLIHAGDMTLTGTKRMITEFANWFSSQPHPYKVLIAGNHDWLFEKEPELAQSLLPENIIYLNDSGVIIEGINIWGSPVQPWFCDWAFNRQRGIDIRKHWDLIPSDTDILITHGPPYGTGDQSSLYSDHIGCKDLAKAVDRIKPKLHVFGHIHGGSGVYGNGPVYINASVLNEQYSPNGKTYEVEI